MQTLHNEPDYEEWLESMNADLNCAGLDVHELAALPYRAWFERGLTPAEAAREAIADADELGEERLIDELDDLP